MAVLSASPREDKPLKYPHMFHAADVMVLNKIGLLPHLTFDVDKCREMALRVNPNITIIQVSAQTGRGWIGGMRGSPRGWQTHDRKGLSNERKREMVVSNGPVERIRVEVEGIVQGVGFRPFVYRLAARYGISGWVRNTPAGVLLEGEGEKSNLSSFLRDISDLAPPLAAISSLRVEPSPQRAKRVFDPCQQRRREQRTAIP